MFITEENELIWRLFQESPQKCKPIDDNIVSSAEIFTTEQLFKIIDTYVPVTRLGSINGYEFTDGMDIYTIFIDTNIPNIVARYNYQVLPDDKGIQVKFNYRYPTTNKGITRNHIYDHLLPKYNIIYSDSHMTEDGLKFWKNSFTRHPENVNFLVYVSGDYKIIQNLEEFDHYYGLNDPNVIFVMVLLDKPSID